MRVGARVGIHPHKIRREGIVLWGFEGEIRMRITFEMQINKITNKKSIDKNKQTNKVP